MDAGRYPLWLVQRESLIARDRINGMLATEMSLMAHMVCAVMNGGESSRTFNSLIERLQDGN
jgi:hypothetical protein